MLYWKQKEHNDTLAKLNFVLALVECIMEVARTRASPLAAALSESIHNRSGTKMATSPSGNYNNNHQQNKIEMKCSVGELKKKKKKN